MTHELFTLFPVPIYKTSITLDRSLDEKIQHLQFLRLESNNGYRSKSKYLLEQPEFDKLKQVLLSHIDEYVYKILSVNKKIKFYITTSWCMKHIKNDFADLHYHNNSVISGILYIHSPKDSGNLIFHKSREFCNLWPEFMVPQFDTYNNLNSSSWTFKPDSNDLFLFPSNLTHSVTNNLTSEDRLCIAFNVFWRGLFGEIESENTGILNIL